MKGITELTRSWNFLWKYIFCRLIKMLFKCYKTSNKISVVLRWLLQNIKYIFWLNHELIARLKIMKNSYLIITFFQATFVSFFKMLLLRVHTKIWFQARVILHFYPAELWRWKNKFMECKRFWTDSWMSFNLSFNQVVIHIFQ